MIIKHSSNVWTSSISLTLTLPTYSGGTPCLIFETVLVYFLLLPAIPATPKFEIVSHFFSTFSNHFSEMIFIS
jgi:hypothetical protein